PPVSQHLAPPRPPLLPYTTLFRSVIYIDNMVPDLEARSAVYQDFRMDIYEALSEAIECLRSYQKLILVYPRKAVYPYPTRIRTGDRKSTRLNSSHVKISYAVFCLK